MMACEKRKEYSKQYYLLNKEWFKQYYLLNRERILAKCRENREIKREQDRHRYVKNRGKMLASVSKRRYQLKLEVLTHYGNGGYACVKCGFDDIRALSIDHIEGGGGQHRLALGLGKYHGTIYRWLKKNNYPEGYQTLCMNCQYIKKYEMGENKWGTKGRQF